MEPVLLVIFALIPPFAYSVYARAVNILPVRMLAALFFGSLGAVLSVSLVQSSLFQGAAGLYGISSILISSFLEAGLLEELVKLAVLALVVNTGFGAPVPAQNVRVVFAGASVLALFIAGFETIVYAFGASYSAIPVRFFTAYPVHVCSSLICSLALVRGVSVCVRGAAAASAAALHGFFDFCLELSGFWLAVALATEILLLISAVLVVVRFREREPQS